MASWADISMLGVLRSGSSDESIGAAVACDRREKGIAVPSSAEIRAVDRVAVLVVDVVRHVICSTAPFRYYECRIAIEVAS